MTTTALVASASAAVLSFFLTQLLITWARRKQLFMPAVRDRDVHTQPTPRVGGIAMGISLLIVIACIAIFAPARINFTDSAFLGIDRNVFGLILAIVLLAWVSIVDDFKGASWKVRLIVQLFAAAVVVYFGVNVPWLSSPLGGRIDLVFLSPLFVILWLVTIANAVNWLDSIDGLAGGVGAISLATLFFLSVSDKVNQPANALLAAVGFGAVVGFLPHNFARRKAFLGETGSIILGFLIGVVAIISGGKVATAFLVLAIPFLDAVVVFFARLLARQSPFKADQRHLPHKLMELGMKRWQIDVAYYFMSLAFGLIALNTQTTGKLAAAAIALIIMASLVGYYSWALKKKSSKNPLQ